MLYVPLAFVCHLSPAFVCMYMYVMHRWAYWTWTLEDLGTRLWTWKSKLYERGRASI